MDSEQQKKYAAYMGVIRGEVSAGRHAVAAAAACNLWHFLSKVAEKADQRATDHAIKRRVAAGDLPKSVEAAVVGVLANDALKAELLDPFTDHAGPDRVAAEPLTVDRAEAMLRARDDWKAVAGIGAATNCPNFEHSSGKRWVHFAHDKVWSRVDGDFWRRCTTDAGFASFLEGNE